MKKNYDNALQMLEHSSTNKKYYLGSLYGLGEIAFEQENYDGAIEYLEQGLNSIDDKTEEGNKYRYLLATCFELKNKINEAIHHWNRIISESPNFRSAKSKLDAYKDIIENKSLEALFLSSLEELQPLVVELISGLNYNIISKDRITSNEYQYKAYNIKRINDPPILINFNRTTREITESEIVEFHKKLNDEKCKSGIYIATTNFSLRAKSASTSKMIELFDKDFVVKAIDKINSKKKLRSSR
jgi:tetratricopeptide (TPR) repeat protein